jgi:hypothetical protein
MSEGVRRREFLEKFLFRILFHIAWLIEWVKLLISMILANSDPDVHRDTPKGWLIADKVSEWLRSVTRNPIWDEKSHGFARVGSNPALVEISSLLPHGYFCALVFVTCNHRKEQESRSFFFFRYEYARIRRKKPRCAEHPCF